MNERPPPGDYVGKDGKSYRVMSDGSTYEVIPRTIRVNGQKVQVPGTYKRVGVTRIKETANVPVETERREGQNEKSLQRQVETAMGRRG